MKITPSLENSPKSQEVAGHRKQKIASTLPPSFHSHHTCRSAPTRCLPSPSLPPLSDHSNQEHKSRWRTMMTIFYQVLYSYSPNEDRRRSEDYVFNFVQASYHPPSSYSSIRCRLSGNLSWWIGLRDDILRAKCTRLPNFWENKNETCER
jgi:hypothetical protein